MNIPEKVKIGWRHYDIELGEHRSGDNGGDVLGEIAYEHNKIYLYHGQSEDNLRVTLLHEILHGIGFHIGNYDFMKNEELISAISENLYQIILDNPELFRPIEADV